MKRNLAVGLCLASALFVPRAGAAATISVAAGGSLQAAIDAAKPGDVIELQAGATFDGPAIVKQLDATTLLLPEQTAEMHKFGSLIVRET